MYTVDYFIEKFEKIPEDLWFMGDYFNENKTSFCALGHCGCDGEEGDTMEGIALYKLLNYDIPEINDGEHNIYQQPTPKQRILAALYDIKKMQSPKEETREDITRSLAVLPVEEKLDLNVKKELV